MSCRMRLSNARATLRGAVEFVGSTESRPPKSALAKSGIWSLFSVPQRVFKLRRWSLGPRRWTGNRTRQGKPGARRNFDLRFSNFDCLAVTGLQSPVENRQSEIRDANPLRSF